MRYTRSDLSSAGKVVHLLEGLKTAKEDLWLQGDNEDTWIIATYDPDSQRYYVSTSLPTDADYMKVFDPTRPHAGVEAVIGGQLSTAWSDSLLDLEAAKAAVLHFFEHQSRHPDLPWRVCKMCCDDL